MGTNIKQRRGRMGRITLKMFEMPNRILSFYKTYIWYIWYMVYKHKHTCVYVNVCVCFWIQIEYHGKGLKLFPRNHRLSNQMSLELLNRDGLEIPKQYMLSLLFLVSHLNFIGRPSLLLKTIHLVTGHTEIKLLLRRKICCW